MKKAAGKIAMLLVILIFANSLTGCFTIWAVDKGINELEFMLYFFPFPTLPILDVISSPIQLIILFAEISKYQELKNKAKSMDQIDTFSANTGFIPDKELFSLTNKFKSLPKPKIAAFTNTVNTLSETEIAAIITAFNNLSAEEITSSIETINSMPEEKLIAALNDTRYIKWRKQ